MLPWLISDKASESSSGPASAHCCARSWDDLELVAWQAHVLQCHSLGGTKAEHCAKGNVLSGMLCMCWKCPEQTWLCPLQRQSLDHCLKREPFSLGHLDSCSDEQQLSIESPGRALFHTAWLPQDYAKPVPLLTLARMSFGDLCPHLLLLLFCLVPTDTGIVAVGTGHTYKAGDGGGRRGLELHCADVPTNWSFGTNLTLCFLFLPTPNPLHYFSQNKNPISRPALPPEH